MNKTAFFLIIILLVITGCQKKDQKKDISKLDISVVHIEITQGLQNKNNTIPLVKGKPTVIRIFPSITQGNESSVEDVSAILHAKRNGKDLPGSPIKPDNGPITITNKPLDRGNPNSSLDFTLDPDWYEKDTDFIAKLELKTQDNDSSNDTKEYKAKYNKRKNLSISYIKVRYTNSNWGGDELPRDRVEDQEACDFLRSIYPAAEVSYDPWSPLEINFADGSASGDLDGEKLISVLNAQFLLKPTESDRLYGWTPEHSYSSNGLSDPLWASGASKVAFGNDTGVSTNPDDYRYRRTFAHEIGHNTNSSGLYHTERRLEDDEYGYDILDIYEDKTVMRYYPEDIGEPNPTSLYDFMRGGEVEPHAWITPPYYQDLYDFLEPDGTADENKTDSTLLVVRGQTTKDNKGQFFDFFEIPAKRIPAVSKQGTHEIRFIKPDKTEKKDLRIAWTPKFLLKKDIKGDTISSRVFSWFIPVPKNIATVQLLIKGEPVNTLKVSSKKPTIKKYGQKEIQSPHDNGEKTIELKWDSIDVDETSDVSKLNHQIFYSNDNGENWQLVGAGLKSKKAKINLNALPGGENSCQFRVHASDGFHTSVTTGPKFTVKTKAPIVNIITPHKGRSYKKGAGILLKGRGFNLQTGKVSSEKLQWSSDIQDSLGVGENIVVRDLKAGTHEITLNIAGTRVKTKVKIEVVAREG